MYIVMLSPFPFVGKHATQHLVILFKFVLKVETLQCAIFFSFTKQYPTLTSSIKLGQVSALRLRTGQLKELPQRLQHSGHGSMGSISLAQLECRKAKQMEFLSTCSKHNPSWANGPSGQLYNYDVGIMPL